jgi:hypothetical protein
MWTGQTRWLNSEQGQEEGAGHPDSYSVGVWSANEADHSPHIGSVFRP